MFREFVLRSCLDCVAPLRILVMFAPVAFVHLAVASRYVKASNDGKEQRRRLAVLLSGVVALVGATFLASCVAVCATSPPCPRAYDLNCSGSNPVMYEVATMALIVCWAASVIWESLVRLRRYLAGRRA